ncbi:unnamed protein product [Cuscuta epithymum]|uniref:Pectinesterase inhibitor domain-containing protein n=1 Tax=Cuscuta epithymum TaxID=186058 RepID=A0AAV0DLZ4_9ASTE|nr:unnamed protein product [Cuscuta epithymum]
MKTSLSFSLIFLITLAFNSRPSSAAAVNHTATSAETDFILTGCNTSTVLYQKLCLKSLSPYARVVNKNTTMLARVAIIISLKKANSVAAYVGNNSLQHNSEILKECSGHLKDSLYEIQRSVKQMKELVGGSAAMMVNNVQTWMSAAETDQDNCLDGTRSYAKLQAQVKTLKMFTSNALALVNAYAEKIANP